MLEKGTPFKFETKIIRYTKPITNGQCPTCDSKKVVQNCEYHPDWVVNKTVFIESKGVLDPKNRAKLRRVKKQHPEIDLRLMFMRDNPLDKKQAKLKKEGKPFNSYSSWADKNGFPYTIGTVVPEEWLR